MSILLGIFTIVLVLVSFFLILVVLMQKAKSDGGMGAAMGGGIAEATFGADTGNVLSKATINLAIVFFVLSIALYLGRIYEHRHAGSSGAALPTIAAPLPKPVQPSTAPVAVPMSSTTPATPSAGTAPSATPSASTTPAAASPAPSEKK
jgi:preprotein translocase subunit SecG